MGLPGYDAAESTAPKRLGPMGGSVAEALSAREGCGARAYTRDAQDFEGLEDLIDAVAL